LKCGFGQAQERLELEAESPGQARGRNFQARSRSTC